MRKNCIALTKAVLSYGKRKNIFFTCFSQTDKAIQGMHPHIDYIFTIIFFRNMKIIYRV